MPLTAANEARRKDLVRRRGSIKGKVTTFKNLIEKHQTDPNLNLLKIHKEKMESAFDTLQEYTSELQELDPEGDHFEEHEALELEYYELLAKVLDIEDRVAAAAASSAAPVSSVNAQPVSPMTLARLPEQALPKFSGRYEDWLSFQDDFQSSIGQRKGLSGIEKLKYLRSCLSGEPERIVKRFETTNEGYLNAWSLLKQMFEDKARIRERHVSGILNITAMQRESARDLSDVVNSLESHAAALKSLGEDTFSTMMMCIALTKIDSATRKLWKLSLKEGQLPTYAELVAFLRRIIISSDEPSTSYKDEKFNRHQRSCNSSHPHNNGKAPKQVRSFATTATNDCNLCNEKHQLFHCQEFRKLSPKEKHQAATRASVCINCLRSGHNIKQCTSSFTCKTCHKKHHTWLHFTEGSSPTSGGSGTAEPTDSQA